MILICLIIIIAFLIVIVILASQKIKGQDTHIKNLFDERSKISNKFRLKGIEADRLMSRIKKAENDFKIRIVG